MLYTNRMPDEWAGALLRRIGKNLRRKRIETGWSMNRMYAETGILAVTIKRWETGERAPRIDDLLWVCKCTGWKLGEILGGMRNAAGTDSRNTAT
jgi:transcriptional regulator with XRE-family HTH domain